MSDHLPAVVAARHDSIVVTPLRSGGRIDVRVETDHLSPAFDGSNIFAALRDFFAQIDAEANRLHDDPIALSVALAHVETMLADLRFVRNTLTSNASSAMNDQRVRRLTVEGAVTVESASEAKRTDWRHEHLLSEMLIRNGVVRWIDRDGEHRTPAELAALILEWVRLEWRVTPVREAGLNPDDFCTVDRDDDGKIIRTPTLRIVDNVIRRQTGTPTHASTTDTDASDADGTADAD